MAITQDTPKVNRHHLLFSATAFEANEITKILRDFFVVDMPGYLHSQLHRELDAKHGICDSEKQIGPKDLPNQSTLEEIFDAFKKEKDKLNNNPTVFDYLTWLKRHIPYGYEHQDCIWLADLVRDELSFFERHEEEMRQM